MDAQIERVSKFPKRLVCSKLTSVHVSATGRRPEQSGWGLYVNGTLRLPMLTV